MKMTSAEMCLKQAVIRGRKSPSESFQTPGTALMGFSWSMPAQDKVKRKLILGGDMDLHQHHAASSAWQHCEKEELCFQTVTSSFFFGSVHETTTLVKIC